jgi:hypothetical protein
MAGAGAEGESVMPPEKPSTDTIDRTIRNLRYHAWPPFAIVAGLVVVLGFAAFILERNTTTSRGFLVYAAICLAASLSVLCLELWFSVLGPVRRLKLGENLLISPRIGKYPPAQVERIDFGSDPAEDYVDQSLPIRMIEVSLTLQPRVRGRLIVSATDAARLREWAVSKGIVVNDPGGDSMTRSVE